MLGSVALGLLILAQPGPPRATLLSNRTTEPDEIRTDAPELIRLPSTGVLVLENDRYSSMPHRVAWTNGALRVTPVKILRKLMRAAVVERESQTPSASKAFWLSSWS